MKQLAEQIVEIAKDYRIDSGNTFDTSHVLTWVQQFEEKDREFLLSELLYILPKSYISKEMVISKLNAIFEYVKNVYKYQSVEELLSYTKFLSCQGAQKSQTKLLEFLNEISIDHFGIKLEDCGANGIKHWIYIDDVLASGGTFKREVIAEIKGYGIDKFKQEGISIIPIFFFLHTWGANVVKFAFKEDFQITLTFHRFFEIENDPRINYFNANPAFNNAYPSLELQDVDLDNYLNNLNASKHREFAYRPKGRPTSEKFYTSEANRIRYESIVLNKSIEIISKVVSLAKPIRPLGLTYPSYATFGTGSHAFTWRNVSNTCPVIYWWENHGWYPLFSVENRGNH